MRFVRFSWLVALAAALPLVAGCPEHKVYDPTPPERHHYETDIARAKLRGVGQTECGCVVFEAKVVLTDSSVWYQREEEPTVNRRLYVEMERLSCQDFLGGVVWRGLTDIKESDFSFHMPGGMSELWGASVAAEVVVVNQADPEQEMLVSIDLEWTGVNTFVDRDDAVFTGHLDPIDGRRVHDVFELATIADDYSPATVDGFMSAVDEDEDEDVVFVMASQKNVRITSRTMDVVRNED
jgi:hypothetical protein